MAPAQKMAEVVAEVLGAGVPLLFYDTCALLDVRRAIRAELSDSGEFVRRRRTSPAAVTKLHRAARTAPRECVLACCDLAVAEYRQHANNVTGETERLVRNAEALLNDVAAVCSDLEITLPDQPLAAAARLPARLGALAEDFLACTQVMDVSDRQLGEARRRCELGGAPAHRTGLRGIVDAAVWLTCVDLARSLRGAGFARPIVFLTSNSADFSAAEDRGRPHNGLVAELNAHGIDYATGWQAAEGKLLHSGEVR